MIYNKDWKYLKRTNFRHTKGLITFSSKTSPKQPLSIKDRMLQQMRYHTMSIHGVSYIWEKDFRLKERLFWLLIIAASVVACFTMYLSLSSRYSKRQLKTVVSTSQMPIYSIYFPTVALCPWTRVNWMRYKAAEEKFLPSSADNKTKNVFYNLVRVLDEMELSQMDSLALLANHSESRIIEKISLNDLASFMAFRCEELFVECFYDETKYDCCKIFVAERTEKGTCLVFNSMVSEESRKKQINDKFYPWKNRKAGEKSGLQFTLRYNDTFKRPQSHINFGINVMIKQCEEWSESLTNFFLPNTKSYLSITPVISETSPSTRHLSPSKRRCLFPDEQSKSYDRIEGLTFNKLNCFVKCQQKNLIKICNCSLSWFFPKTDVKDCTVADLECIYVNRDIFTYIKSPFQDDYIMDTRRGVECDCVDSCTSLVFLTGLNANMLQRPNASHPVVKGDVYIGQGVITKYETRLYSTPFDLIAKFGGILGLCLGTSILNLAEIVYAILKIFVLFLFSKLFQARKVKPISNRRMNRKLNIIE